MTYIDTDKAEAHEDEGQEAPQPLECRSEEGITVGLIDALISIIRVLAPRDLSPGDVQEALMDLFMDDDFATIRNTWLSQTEMFDQEDYQP